MRRAFSLVELLIVTAILGILAAVAMPMFQQRITKAKEAAAKDNLRILRNVIDVYAVQHKNVPPGYANGNTSNTPTSLLAMIQLTYQTNELGQYDKPGTSGYIYGPYLKAIPENPFNGDNRIYVIANASTEVSAAVSDFGWIYKPAIKEIKLNYNGVDSQGVRYLDY